LFLVGVGEGRASIREVPEPRGAAQISGGNA